MFQDKGFFYMNVRLRMYKYSYLNVGVIYPKGLSIIRSSSFWTFSFSGGDKSGQSKKRMNTFTIIQDG